MNKLQWFLLTVLVLGLINNCHQTNVIEAEVADIGFRSTYFASGYGAGGGQLKMVLDIEQVGFGGRSGKNRKYTITSQFIGDYLTTDTWSGELIADDVTESDGYYYVGLDQWKFGGGMVDDAVIIIPKSTGGRDPISVEIDPTRDRVYGKVWKFEKMNY